jgi:hypothetical protein
LLLTKSDSCQQYPGAPAGLENPAGARFDPLISSHVFGAIVGLSPSALATSEISGAGAPARMVKVRDMNWRAPLSHPSWKKK